MNTLILHSPRHETTHRLNLRGKILIVLGAVGLGIAMLSQITTNPDKPSKQSPQSYYPDLARYDWQGYYRIAPQPVGR